MIRAGYIQSFGAVRHPALFRDNIANMIAAQETLFSEDGEEREAALDDDAIDEVRKDRPKES